MDRGGEEKKWGFEKKNIPSSRHNDRKCCVEGFFFPPPAPNQAAIQVSGEALTLAYTSKSFQRHLQLHSCFTGTLQALRTAASSKENLIPGAPSPQHTSSTPPSLEPVSTLGR